MTTEQKDSTTQREGPNAKSQQPPKPGPEHQRLGMWAGTWQADGSAYPDKNAPTASAKMTVIDTCEWLPGAFFLVHRWDGQVGDAPFQGMEVIGYDPASRIYLSKFFDNAGNSETYKVTIAGNTWTYSGEEQRATVVFGDDGQTMTTHWEQLSDAKEWVTLCDLKVKKAK